MGRWERLRRKPTSAARRPADSGGGRHPLVIGHRGFPGRHPDNSLPGVRAALAAGADGVEVDVRRCADGVWVCHHDLRRAGRPVREWAFSALAVENVPSLAQVVAALPVQAWLFVEIKPLPQFELEQGSRELRLLLQPRLAFTMVLSSSLAVLDVVVEALPGAARSWVVASLPAEAPPEGAALSPHHTLVEQVRRFGVPIHPWTVNRVRRARELIGVGVASLTSNRPDLLVEVMRE